MLPYIAYMDPMGNGKSMKIRENGGNPLKYPEEKPQIWMIV
jgi:hypothetical protein